MLKWFSFAGRLSTEFGAYVTDAGVQDSPKKRYEQIKVKGRNGDLMIDLDSYDNLTLEYPAVIPEDFDVNFAALRSFLLSQNGYQRIEDEFHPNEYRLGMFTDAVKPKLPSLKWQYGTFTLKFNCKPQRYLKSGEMEIEFTADGDMYNETQFTAKPLVRVYGTGIFGIGNQIVQITEADEYTDIDCEAMECYKGTTNCNNKVNLLSGKFPELYSGQNGVVLGTGITKIVLTPRWWTL